MLTSILIIAFSLVLLVYWFRYSCILLLRNYPNAPAPITVDTRFRVVEVQERLRTEEQLDPLHQSLQRDYQVLSYLLAHAAGLELGSFEDRLLVLDYKMMQWWYLLTKTAAPEQARQALLEMASVLGILVGKIDQRVGVNMEA